MARKKQNQEEKEKKIEEKTEEKSNLESKKKEAERNKMVEEKQEIVEEKTEEKKELAKSKQENVEKKITVPEDQKKIKKDKAIVRGVSLRISTKQSKYILKMIKGKKINDAIKMLEEVLEFKRAVPMRELEVPHRKGIAGGRYPLNASKEIIKLLKQLKANAMVSGIENPYINLAMANIASRPYRRGRTRGKRTHIYIEAKEFLGGEK